MPVPDKYKILPEKLRETYNRLYDKLHQHMLLLSAPDCDIDALITAFNEFFQHREIGVEVTHEAAATAAEASLPQFINHEEGILALPEHSIAQRNFKRLAIHVMNSMDFYDRKHGLAYHNTGHAMEMSHDVAFLAEQMRMFSWKPLLACAGLFHDAVFDRQRGLDEEASAKLMVNALRDFIHELGDSKKYFIALIHILIVGGTLPVFYRRLDGEQANVYFFTLWQLYLENHPECLTEKTEALLKACMALSDSDVQRSLMPGVLRAFPGCAPALKELRTQAPRLMDIITSYYDRRPEIHDAARMSRDEYYQMIFTKLGQNIRVIIETCALDNERLAGLQVKLNSFLRTSVFRNAVGKPEPLTEDDITMLWNKIFKAEMGFAEMNIASLNRKNSVTAARSYPFLIDSWYWHCDLYKRLQGLTLTDKYRVTEALLNNARQQPGIRFDADALSAFVCQLPPPSMPAIFRIFSACSGSEESADPSAARLDVATAEGAADELAEPASGVSSSAAIEAVDEPSTSEAGAKCCPSLRSLGRLGIFRHRDDTSRTTRLKSGQVVPVDRELRRHGT